MRNSTNGDPDDRWFRDAVQQLGEGTLECLARASGVKVGEVRLQREYSRQKFWLEPGLALDRRYELFILLPFPDMGGIPAAFLMCSDAALVALRDVLRSERDVR